MFVRRVMVALISRAAKKANWPDATERKEIKERIFRKSGFPECLGFVDGTHVVLYACPAKNWEDY